MARSGTYIRRRFTAPSGGVTKGAGYLIGGLFVVARANAAEGAQFTGAQGGVWTLPKTSAQAWTQGQKLYRNASTGAIDSDPTTGPLIGVAYEVAANPSSTGSVVVTGAPADISEGPQGNIVALTDNTGGSGTHDDTLADGLTSVALTEGGGAIGGTSDGDLTALVDPAGDSGASVIAGIRECATAINTLITDATVQNQNASDLAQKVNELIASLVAAGVIQSA